MKKLKIENWEINNIKCSGYAIFDKIFTEEYLNKIQNWYNKRDKNINFKKKVIINDIPYKNRYLLDVYWDNGEKAIGFIMFNPSFANLNNPDNTIRNTIKYVNNLNQGYNRIIIQNLFPIRISGADFVCKYYKEELKKEFLKKYECKINFDILPNDVVLCWGKLPQKIPYIDKIIDKLYSKLKEKQKNLYQITNDNFQRHIASPSINAIKGINHLKLKDIKTIYKFHK